MAKKKEELEEKILDVDASMQGSITFKDPVNLRINGSFEGKLETKGSLTIGENAKVRANIAGDRIVIAGKVKGDIIAKKMLVLMPTAVLTGNISTPKLNIVEGAVFQGRCQMLEEFLDLDELSKYLEIDQPTILELANSGKIPAARSGDTWVFERHQIDHWAALGRSK